MGGKAMLFKASLIPVRKSAVVYGVDTSAKIDAHYPGRPRYVTCY